jgi:uncharacterized repeat protein (TIGR03833 family)
LHGILLGEDFLIIKIRVPRISPVGQMPRNSASGANKQRRRPQTDSSDRHTPFTPTPTHSDPNKRLDGQNIQQSFAPLQRTRQQPDTVVGAPGWKTEEKKSDTVSPSINHDDVWRQLWGDANSTTAVQPQQQPARSSHKSLRRSANSSSAISQTTTQALYKNHPSIPKATVVVPGKSADIVLKQDQGTGRTVNGIIGDVLSRGDHPWGIKVRLKDGRVGRVQKVY